MLNEQAINEVCLNCTKADCAGICDELRATMGKTNDEGRRITLTWRGVTRPVAQWAEILGVTRQTLYNRIRKGQSADDIFESAITVDLAREPTTYEHIEEVYLRLTRMHIDYELCWETPTEKKASLGMVTNYGKVQSGVTNNISKPVEILAIPEAMMSDDLIERRAWIAMVLYMIERYNTRKGRYANTGESLAYILEMRALKGFTLRKILQLHNEKYATTFTMVAMRKRMDTIVVDLVQEANKRGLFRIAQK